MHRRLVAIARERKIAPGHKLRVDTTVVETNIHYPTDRSLLGDGVRVLTRVMKKVNEAAEGAGTRLRDRSRSVKLRVVEIARVSRSKSQQGQERMRSYTESCWRPVDVWLVKPAGLSKRPPRGSSNPRMC
jgi:IS5 family transposase